MQSHSRSLGESGTVSNFGSTLGSTFGKSDVAASPRGPLERQISKQDPPKSMAQGGLSGTAQLSQSGTSTATGANFVPWTKALGSVIASPGKLASPKTKASKLAGRPGMQDKLPANLALRAQNIEAKCSPDVRRAFRSKPVEKCSCATITAVWSACDTFWEIDTTHSGAITRQVYMDFLRYICPSVNTLRMLRRARLECRFRSSAVPVRLEDFLAMVWPTATIEDRAKMLRWAELRECYDIISHRFSATDQDLEKLFTLLCGPPMKPGEPQKVLASELSRSRILPRDVVVGFAKERHLKEVAFDYEEFKSIAWPKLKERWMSKDSFNKQKAVEEKEQPLRGAWPGRRNDDQG